MTNDSNECQHNTESSCLTFSIFPRYSDSPFGVSKDDRWNLDSADNASSTGWGSSKRDKVTTIEDIPVHKPDDDRYKYLVPSANTSVSVQPSNANSFVACFFIWGIL